jgi:putative transposase
MYYFYLLLKSYKYRLLPTNKQAELINKHIGSCRFVYNLALEVKNYAYATQRKNLSCFDLISQLPALKEECPWLREIDSQALQQSVINLDKAFTQFFKGHAAFPKFKNKYANQSFRNPHGNKVEIKDGKIYQPKFKDGIKVVVDRQFNGVIKSTTISRTPTGKYFVSVLVESSKENPKTKPIREATAIGVDLGIKDFIVTSEGLKVNNPRHLQKLLSHLKYLGRQHSKKKKGSNNRRKSQLKLALCHEKIVNQRKDFLHKLSTQLIKNHDTLCLEDLQIENMIKNRRLAQAIQSAGWGMFVDYCKYKAEWNGKNIIQIPTFQPSTKICSNCGHTNHTLMLSDREWVCANCTTLHDRDINAAINIKNYSLNNCGGVRRGKPVELPTLAGALKQEL